jgi:hypothetical protein
VSLTAQERAALRQRLDDEGVRPQPKRRPFAPKRIGVISGRHAAGLEDFESALIRSPFVYDLRRESIPLFGPGAASECCNAIARLASTADLIVLVRGGGSAGSFAMFDDDRVVRAVASCKTPIVCGVGHARNRFLADEYAYNSSISPSDAAHAIIAFSEDDARQLNTATQLARDAVNRAITKRRGAEWKKFAIGFVLSLLLLLPLYGLEHAVLALMVAVTICAAAWIALLQYRRRRARVERLVLPDITSPGVGHDWLLHVPDRLSSLNQDHLFKLREIVESVRQSARRQM